MSCCLSCCLSLVRNPYSVSYFRPSILTDQAARLPSSCDLDKLSILCLVCRDTCHFLASGERKFILCYGYCRKNHPHFKAKSQEILEVTHIKKYPANEQISLFIFTSLVNVPLRQKFVWFIPPLEERLTSYLPYSDPFLCVVLTATFQKDKTGRWDRT